MINGQQTELFVTDLAPEIIKVMSKNKELKALNDKIRVACELFMNLKESKNEFNEQNKSVNVEKQIKQIVHLDKCIAPNSNKQAEGYAICPICITYCDERAVDCASCLNWYHYVCLKLTDSEIVQFETSSTELFTCNSCAQLQDFVDLESCRGGDNIISDDDEVTEMKTLYVSPGKHNTSNMIQDIQTTKHSEKQGCQIRNQISEQVSQNTAFTSENCLNLEKRGTISQKHIDQPMNVTQIGTCTRVEKQTPQPRMNTQGNLGHLTLLSQNHQETQTCPSLLPPLDHENCKRDIDKKTKETREHATKLRKVETELAQYKSQLSTTKSYIASLELKFKRKMEDSNRNLKTKIFLMQDNNPKITSDQQTLSQHVDRSNDIKLLLHEQRIRQLEHENLKVSIRMEKLETLSSMNLPHTIRRLNRTLLRSQKNPLHTLNLRVVKSLTVYLIQ
ncbi:unnamed protein product [Mytilus coruscus]|uniref:PHD-type domain-containing protein n=1 Tax=Mytilus coruscus TaxID=42192 RepID=A0A6J8D8V8_MYTCO|nr:unnamed protein product [Mytilus coruscus]